MSFFQKLFGKQEPQQTDSEVQKLYADDDRKALAKMNFALRILPLHEEPYERTSDMLNMADKNGNHREYDEICYTDIENGCIKGFYVNPLEMPPQYIWTYQNYAVPIQNGVIKLPSKINEHIINGVMDFWCMGSMKWETGSSKVRVMIIPDTFHFIGQKNFVHYASLETLYLPQNIELREFAFAYCPSLTKVYIGIQPGEEHLAHTIDKEEAMSLFHKRWGIFDGCNKSLQFYVL